MSLILGIRLIGVSFKTLKNLPSWPSGKLRISSLSVEHIFTEDVVVESNILWTDDVKRNSNHFSSYLH